LPPLSRCRVGEGGEAQTTSYQGILSAGGNNSKTAEQQGVLMGVQYVEKDGKEGIRVKRPIHWRIQL